ncbi:MAG: endonuclease/exonuclease/phosphatase family protein [Burkholderiaceae bacterium]
MNQSGGVNQTIKTFAARISLLVLRALIVPAAAASAIAAFASHWWFADLMTHFRLQYLLVGLIGLVPMILLKRRGLACLAAVCLVLNLYPAVQYFQSPQYQSAGQEDRLVVPLRVAGLNVFFRNSNYAGVATWMKQEQPDVVVLVEASARWQEALSKLAPAWQYQHLAVKPGRSGKLILSRIPIEQIRALDSKNVRSPTPVATFNHRGARFRLAAVHTIWPMGEARTAERNESLNHLERQASLPGPPLIAIGDFNISPFSPHFQALANRGKLIRAAAGHGWLPTWPVFLPAAGIQIDHVLVSPVITVDGIKTRSELGSDHRAILVDLSLPR